MKKIFSHIMEGGWNVAVRNTGTGNILKDDVSSFYIIPNTWRTWAADPFVIEVNERVYIFAEIFDYIERKGKIGYTSFAGGKWTKWRIVLDEPFHMSYPNLFRCGDDIYMIPESSANQTLRVYKAVAFPNEWKLEKIIAQDVKWVDTTFFLKDNVVCAITTDISDEKHVDYLLTFDQQLNLLTKTKINELCTEYSRSGGAIFAVDKGWVRVSQDCSLHYGGAMIFSEFIPEMLCEQGMGRRVLHLYPNDIVVNQNYLWTGIHTYNSTKNYEVIDIERKHFNLFGIISRLLSKLEQ